jgi:hypothetical protein
MNHSIIKVIGIRQLWMNLHTVCTFEGSEFSSNTVPALRVVGKSLIQLWI